MFNTIKKINPFKKKIDYKVLYEKEAQRKEELTQIHTYVCKQLSIVLEESRQKYNVYNEKNIKERL